MHGNLWEWCADCWHDNYQGAPTDGRVWEGDGSRLVLRGGAWDFSPTVRQSGFPLRGLGWQPRRRRRLSAGQVFLRFGFLVF
jgi:formylglycine-generating enzyme required for sulfatase activity